MKVKVSVVMTTYNHERYIRKSIESVLMQKVNFNFEILIGDDVSPDNTAKILMEYKEKFPNKIKLFLRKENLGPTKNICDLYNKCSGKYIATLEGDDYWTDENKLQRQVDYLEAHEEYIATTHAVEYFNEDNEVFFIDPNLQYDELEGIDKLIECEKNHLTIGHLQSLVFRNIFPNKKYEEIITCNRFVEDLPLKFILLSIGKIKYLDYVMGRYRNIRKNSTSFSSLDYKKQMEYQLLVWDKINEITNFQYKDEIDKITNNLRIRCFHIIKDNKQYKKAIDYYIKELKLKNKIEIIKHYYNKCLN